MLIDLHVYTQASGGAPVAQAIDDAKNAGLDGILIADRQASADAAKYIVANESEDFKVFVGVEIPTRTGDVILVTPEIDPLFTREEWRELDALGIPYLHEVVALAERRGGVVLVAQPYDRSRKNAPRDRMFALAGVAGYEAGTQSSDVVANDLATASVAHASGPSFGGSATSRNRGPQGEAWFTLFADPISDQASLIDALKGGDYWAIEVDDGKRRRGGRGRDDSRRSGGRDGGGRDGGGRDGGGRSGGRRDGGGGREGGRRSGGRRSRSESAA